MNNKTYDQLMINNFITKIIYIMAIKKNLKRPFKDFYFFFYFIDHNIIKYETNFA